MKPMFSLHGNNKNWDLTMKRFCFFFNMKSMQGPSHCVVRGRWVLMMIKLIRLKHRRNPDLKGMFWVVCSSSLPSELVSFETQEGVTPIYSFFSEEGPYTWADCSGFVRKFFMLNLPIPCSLWPYFPRLSPLVFTSSDITFRS